jgi:hypothetical protein
VPITQVIAEVNRFLAGCDGDFRQGNPRRSIAALNWYVMERCGVTLPPRPERTGAQSGLGNFADSTGISNRIAVASSTPVARVSTSCDRAVMSR